mmetsp:Transcript_15766/g.15957  ORF Transcript_15766/g.15957 Transcript_15766/m.15957 type:complete len:232 (+) Transcript_15766:640-1335(+)
MPSAHPRMNHANTHRRIIPSPPPPPRTKKPSPSTTSASPVKTTRPTAHSTGSTTAPPKSRRRDAMPSPKKKRGSLSSNECKIFVSGLPFTVTGKDVEDYFGLKLGVGEGLSKAIQCQLLTFKDTKRCNGQAYLVFATKDMVETALTLHKAVYDGQTSNDPKKKTKKDTGKDVNAKPEKERWLAVTRCVNRIESKKMMRQRRWMENGKRASHMQKWEKEQTQTPKQDGAKFE